MNKFARILDTLEYVFFILWLTVELLFLSPIMIYSYCKTYGKGTLPSLWEHIKELYSKEFWDKFKEL